MAIIAERLGYLFLLTPRTGSSATAWALEEQHAGDARWLPDEDVMGEDGELLVPRKHTTVSDLVQHGVLGADKIGELVVFCGVRNPFDSLVSLYTKYRHQYVPLLDDPAAFIHRKSAMLEDMRFVRDHSFSEWIREKYDPPETARPRSLYGKYLRDADEVVRFESLEADVNRVLDTLGAPRIAIPRFNETVGRATDYRSYYDDDARERVAAAFAGELERFGYRFS